MEALLVECIRIASIMSLLSQNQQVWRVEEAVGAFSIRWLVLTMPSGKSFTIVSNTTGKNINIQKSNLTIPGENLTPVVVMEGQFKFSTTTHERRLFYANITKLPDATVLGYISVNLDTQGKMKLQYPSPTGNATVEIGDYAVDKSEDIVERLSNAFKGGRLLG